MKALGLVVSGPFLIPGAWFVGFIKRTNINYINCYIHDDLVMCSVLSYKQYTSVLILYL